MNLEQFTQLVQDVHDGNESALKAYAIINDSIKLLTSCKKEIEEAAKKEGSTYGAKTFNEYGYVFEMRNGGRVWDFKHLDEWQQANVKKKAIEEKYKTAFNAKANGFSGLNEETGEIIELPKVSYKSDSLIVKFKNT